MSKERRDRRIEIRLNATEQRMLEYICEGSGLTVSEFIRAVIKKYYYEGGSY